jgi:hypothetical protein
MPELASKDKSNLAVAGQPVLLNEQFHFLPRNHSPWGDMACILLLIGRQGV